MKNPRVQVKPRLFRKTAAKRLRCVPVPFAGAVLTGTGAVRTLPTRTVPVRNPSCQLRPTIEGARGPLVQGRRLSEQERSARNPTLR